ncbi:uncharacterized protein [Prorops nasuta]|uniref:uncharacterized protein n=1 Tax=Prorops nasuta TaxID=863751 RepID=UPI0034CF21E7
MNNKTENNYYQIFTFIKNKFKNFSPVEITTDYEAAISNALRMIFPNVKNNFCYFHYSQAFIKNAEKLKIINREKNKLTYPERYIVIKKIIYLALLPYFYIKEVYELIKKETVQEFGDFFNKFFIYYERQWLSKVGPEQFSVYNKTNRTNNYVESYQRTLNKSLGKHPHFNLFFNKISILLCLYYIKEILNTLKELTIEAKDIKEKMEMNSYKTRVKKKATVKYSQEINNFWEKLRNVDVTQNNEASIEVDLPNITIDKNYNEEIISKLISLKNKYLQTHEKITFTLVNNVQ